MASPTPASAAWKQFLLGRRAILAEYDRAREHARTQAVQTHHGVVAEAAFRNWLATFLPKRFGVTAGYIRSQGMPDSFQSPHFDVIVYDQLESPVLWVEENSDKSEGGKARIIPVEHVKCVLEVKSSFSRSTVEDALQKLAELHPLVEGVDAEGERYPRFFPGDTVLGLVFMELRDADQSDLGALELLRAVNLGRSFYGGIILRGEGLAADMSGQLHGVRSDTPMEGFGSLLRGVAMTASIDVGGDNLGFMLTWSATYFSQFAFDIVALLKGTYDGRVSSFHGYDFSQLKR